MTQGHQLWEARGDSRPLAGGLLRSTLARVTQRALLEGGVLERPRAGAALPSPKGPEIGRTLALTTPRKPGSHPCPRCGLCLKAVLSCPRGQVDNMHWGWTGNKRWSWTGRPCSSIPGGPDALGDRLLDWGQREACMWLLSGSKLVWCPQPSTSPPRKSGYDTLKLAGFQAGGGEGRRVAEPWAARYRWVPGPCSHTRGTWPGCPPCRGDTVAPCAEAWPGHSLALFLWKPHREPQQADFCQKVSCGLSRAATLGAGYAFGYLASKPG